MASIDLIVLGMIKKRPQSAYDLQKEIDYRNISKWVKISVPSIYKKVVSLEEKGYLQSETVKENKMPDKKIYKITEKGEKLFFDLIQENARKSVNVFLDFNSVIMNLELVPEDMQKDLLQQIEIQIQERYHLLQENMVMKKHIPIAGKGILEQQFNIMLCLQEWINDFKNVYLGTFEEKLEKPEE